MQLNPLRHLYVDRHPEADRTFLSAASGLVVSGDRVFIVADDDLHLATFAASGSEPGQLLRLLPGMLPSEAADRKAQKPDFEILLALPTDNHGCRLLAMGSGSTERRRRAVLIEFGGHGELEKRITLDLTALFAAISALTSEVNLEGALVRGDRLLLFNRGNQSNPETDVFEADLHAITSGQDPDVTKICSLTLPMIGETPLTVTDACYTNDGQILLSAVAEATDNSYADGELAGSALIILDADLRVKSVVHLERAVKIEGVATRPATGGQEILCVTDADDPERPATLYSVIM